MDGFVDKASKAASFIGPDKMFVLIMTIIVGLLVVIVLALVFAAFSKGSISFGKIAVDFKEDTKIK